MDFSFVAEAVGSVAFAYAAVKVTPIIAATILVILDKMDASKAESLFKSGKRGF